MNQTSKGELPPRGPTQVMIGLPSELAELFVGLDAQWRTTVDWLQLSRAIHDRATGREQEETFERLKWEWMAAAFLPEDPHSAEHWGTYFGPMRVMPDPEGRWTESPSIQSVDESVLTYWLARAHETKNPQLRARYADLVWDLGDKVAKYTRPIEALRLAVDGYLEATRELDEADLHERLQWVGRAGGDRSGTSPARRPSLRKPPWTAPKPKGHLLPDQQRHHRGPTLARAPPKTSP
jgi:hypothetical protein